jgi:hypothetical protein
MKSGGGPPHSKTLTRAFVAENKGVMNEMGWCGTSDWFFAGYEYFSPFSQFFTPFLRYKGLISRRLGR